jgi:hypothetical protein
LFAVLGAAALAAPSSLAHSTDQTKQGGVFLRYLNAPEDGGNLRGIPTLWLSFGGQRYRAVMDTGSTGVVVSALSIPNIDQLPSRGPGTLTYSSSGRIMRGDWVLVSMVISGANGASLTTNPIPVLAVRSIDCTDDARSCTPREDPRHVAMIGVGFARKRNPQADSGPSKNPFLNVSGADVGPNRPRRGYVVTREGVQVGLAGANPPRDFATVPLRFDNELGDWTGAPACIAINDRAPAACGNILPDTGVTVMFLTVPPGQEQGSAISAGTGRTLVPGTKVTISLAPGTPARGAVSDYSFRVGDTADPMAPARVILVGRGDRPTFVNTSVRLLNGFDYLFDADNGIVGYRWTGRQPGLNAPARSDGSDGR